jgi:hypothetical protein
VCHLWCEQAFWRRCRRTVTDLFKSRIILRSWELRESCETWELIPETWSVSMVLWTCEPLNNVFNYKSGVALFSVRGFLTRKVFNKAALHTAQLSFISLILLICIGFCFELLVIYLGLQIWWHFHRIIVLLLCWEWGCEIWCFLT